MEQIGELDAGAAVAGEHKRAAQATEYLAQAARLFARATPEEQRRVARQTARPRGLVVEADGTLTMRRVSRPLSPAKSATPSRPYPRSTTSNFRRAPASE